MLGNWDVTYSRTTRKCSSYKHVRLKWRCWDNMTIIFKHYSPCDTTPSSSSACHIPAAWGLVCIADDSANNQSTNSVPGAHLRTRRPDTFLSFRQVFWPAMKTVSRMTVKSSTRYHANVSTSDSVLIQETAWKIWKKCRRLSYKTQLGLTLSLRFYV